MRWFIKMSVLFVVLFGGFAGTAEGVTFSTFTTPPSFMPQGTIGFTYAGNKFVGTVLQNGTGSLYSTDLSGGSQQAFAPTVSLTSGTAEHYVAASFAVGGFVGGEIYAADGSNIVKISNNGATSSTFVSGLNGDVRGITFDLNGSFGNKMLVTTSNGFVYTVTSGGTVATLTTLPQDVEGLDIAPAGFGAFGGQLIVASESTGTLRAIKANGTTQVLPFTVASSEELTFVPPVLFGGALEGLYGANFMPNIQKANGSQFLGFEGDLIVTGETTSQVSRVHWDIPSSTFQVSNIGAFPNQPEDGVFVTQQMVDLSAPEPSTFVLGGIGLLALLMVARRKRATARA